LLTCLKEQTGRSPSALKKALSAEIEPRDQQRLRTACNNDPQLFDRVLAFAGLIRQDTLGYPVVILEGSVYVTEGVDRRQTGTHYTPRNLTEEIVQYTLEPLVFEGVAEGKPKEQWRLRSAAELLQLKICDMAMGSGAFLVQTCRYLAGKLVEAWQQAEAEHPGQVVIAPEGTLSGARPDECPIPKDLDERLLVARRIVADRCLYGVDKNPLAVEMAKLSLWLVTLAKGRPFTFLDHALKWGDSLLGITRAEQIEYLHLNPDNEAVQYPIASQIWQPILQDAIAKRRKLESFSVNGIEDLQEKERLFQEAERAIDRLRFVGDYLIGRALADAGKTSDLTTEDLMVVSQRIEQELAGKVTAEQTRDITALKASAERMLNLGNPANQSPRKPFHWLLEFPEVFLEGETKGFAAIVGNPPFQGGGKVSETLGTNYREYLVDHIANGQRGPADLCAYFFLRSRQIMQLSGGLGLIATNTIAQGDTREVGLDQLILDGWSIRRAVSSRKWIGTANLEVAYVWLWQGAWLGEFVLDEQIVSGITSFLTKPNKTLGIPFCLASNQGISFKGSDVYGSGFILSPDEAELLIAQNFRNKDVLFPLLNGEDLNSRPDQSPSRWVINFSDWALDSEHDDIKQPKGPPYAVDYPECLDIIRKRAKPERDKLATGGASARDRAKRWWQFSRPTTILYQTISELGRVLVIPRVSKFLTVTFSSTEVVISDAAVAIASESSATFSLVQSTIHQAWTLTYQSTLETRGRYTPSDCFETFPFPTSDPSDLSAQFPTLDAIGETYYTHRQAVMRERQEGLTKIYNRFHDPNETADDIQKLRELHIEMDREVANAYGWQDLDLGHDFHTTKQGIRFTISETARREVLDRLLELNHQRYAEEVAQGLHDKKKAKGKGKKAASKAKPSKAESEEPMQGSLF
jgi:hypothetical protein